MAQEIKLPQLGQTMEEGTIVNVLIKEGDKINKGDVIFEVETDKATLEMESTAAGFVKQILVAEGDTIPVGEVVCVVGEENEQVDAPAKKAEPKSQEVAQAPVAKTEAPATPAKSKSLPDGVKIVRLPQLGQTMEEGTIVNLVIKVGDKLAKGDVVLEVETDKATLEMESSVEGVVKAILVEEGDTIPVEAPVAIVAAEGVEITDAMIAGVKGGDEAPVQPKEEPVKQEVAPKAAPVAVKAAVVAPKAAPVVAGDRIFATPRAKMVAQELGVDLANVSAKQGAVRIVEADVRAAASAKPTVAPTSAPAAKVAMPAPEYNLGDTVPMTRMQKVVGERMLQSKQNIPCFYLNTSVDMTELFKFRSEFNKKSSVKVSFNDFIIKAMALGCKQFPIMAGQLDGNNIKIAGSVDVGLAISVEDGLVAPVCKNADSKSIVEVAASNVAMIDRAKNGKLTPDELSGGCITLSNLGAFGVEWFIPIVVPGQCCIFGTGKIKDTLVPQDGNILVRKIMTMTVSVDHKVANGAYAAQFLDYVKKLLENTSTFV